jgi:hypothetical protein
VVRQEVVEVDVPEMWFLMVDGEGDPATSEPYRQAVEALFTVSYAVKFAVKRGPAAVDYGVMPLEGLWWAEDMESFALGVRSAWKWTMMIMQPEVVSAGLVEEAAADVFRKKSLTALSLLRFEPFAEGRCAQIMHVGPFSAEGASIEKVHGFIEERGCVKRGKHHEIYLSDIRRSDPSRWKTVIRQPMG